MVAVVGHRGAAGLEPENTLQAFDRAVDTGVDAVEFDVRATADDHLVVIHDRRVDRTTDGTGVVAEFTLAELRELDAGDGQPVPTLGETLDHLAGATVDLVVELKEPVGAETLAAVRERSLLERTRLAAFEWEFLEDVADAGVRIGGPIPADAGSVDVAARRGYSYVGIRHGQLTPELAGRAHAEGLLVGAWTVDDPAAIECAIDRGADSITTDRPDVALDVVGSVESCGHG